MSLRLLGTGSADGWPNPFCRCASCAVERAAGRTRGQTAALVDGVLLLDCGSETPQAALRAGVTLDGVRVVLLTHQHSDHVAPCFLLHRSWVADGPLSVAGPPEVIESCRSWVPDDTDVAFVAVRPGDTLDVEGYAVRVLDAAHRIGLAAGGVVDSVLYDVTTPSGQRLLYATDTGPLTASTIDAVTGAQFDVVLLDETFGDRIGSSTGHLDLASFPEQLRLLRAVGAVVRSTDVVAVHLSHHNPPTPQLARRLAAWGSRVVDDGTVVGRLSPSPVGEPETTRRVLVLGGARSGKSREAQRLLAAAPDVTYVATAYPADSDPEWAERVARHRASRPSTWATVESLDLAGLLADDGGPLLVDCLTLWLTRVMDRHDAWDDVTWAATGEKAAEAEIDELVEAWRSTRRRVVAVSNEVGQGVVPATRSGRRFRDLMGVLNARLAAETEEVLWCVAGRVTRL